ncbi:HAMP domain-containing sensor histidine kinase [Chryseobacterium fluminis]|uniref:sensor histidine kinase n=1 Tax=Chryseobacterium fluminis TaxID=2983606 RepID=UPI002259B060|nr:HAMP domain-containing sensor histidine kinase [Chryseobacterium sp. MMS21-Ot14]UZT96874.1 HAMP domain-containing sensor histidine kinase [Chryseobacterium sp. MMS21-Ot14]
MILKSKYLISLFAALFLLLLGIQVYFMYKTYQVKEREIYRTVHEGLTHYTDKLEDAGGLKKADKDDIIQKLFIDYHHKKISRKDFLGYFEKNRKENQSRLSKYIDQKFEKEGYLIAAKIQYISIIYIPDSTKLIDHPIVLYDTENRLEKVGISNSGRWETSSSATNDENKKLEKNDSFLVKSKTEFQILNIKSIVFKELTLLILCCTSLLLSVLLIYLFTVRNLIKQQKQVDMLHTVVDNISHEFKTPIATLKIASKTLKKEFNPETLPLIDRQIQRLENLMLQLHTDEPETEVIKIKPADWDFFVHDLAFTYPDIKFNLKNTVCEEFHLDKNLMETVIKNLCENSVKYGASDIKIDISSSKDTLEIGVSDNGDGIEKSELNNIFEKFYRIQSNNIHNTKGLGLGLYFVKKIITKYNGKVDVSSTVNSGTVFKISIPYEH